MHRPRTFIGRVTCAASLAILGVWLATEACGGSSQKPTPAPSPTPAPQPPPGPWQLTWSDEFDGADGSAPDPGKWTYDIGGGGWGNDELETYTDRRDNSFLKDGKLVIRARAENYRGPDGIDRPYTSARLKTQGLFSQTHGKFEARMRLPRGQGVWPAFWLLGDDISGVGWPECGEIDIMENIGREPSIIHGTMHGPGYSGGGGPTAASSVPGAFADDFHVFGIEWEEQRIRWYMDGTLYETRTPADVTGSRWVFEHPFFIILNLAIGGNWPGSPDQTTSFPQDLVIDWVHVYSR